MHARDRRFWQVALALALLACAVMTCPRPRETAQALLQRHALSRDLDRWSRWTHRLEAPLRIEVREAGIEVRSWQRRRGSWMWGSTLVPVTRQSADASEPAVRRVLQEALLELGDVLVELEALARDGGYAVPRRFVAHHPPSWLGGVLLAIRVETPACEGLAVVLRQVLHSGYAQTAFDTGEGWRLRGASPLRDGECAALRQAAPAVR